MLGWYGSESLEDALADSQCGCELWHSAQRVSNPEGRAALVAAAEEYQDLWACPYRGNPFPSTPDHLPPECHEALQGVERLTGATGFCTCPLAYLRPGAPAGEAVERVSVAVSFKEDGCLDAVEGKAPSAAIVQAITVVERARKARDVHEWKLAKEKAKPSSSSPSEVNIHHHGNRGINDPEDDD